MTEEILQRKIKLESTVKPQIVTDGYTQSKHSDFSWLWKKKLPDAKLAEPQP